MKRFALIALLTLLTGWLVGCQREEAESERAESATLNLFEKGRGVRLPEDIRQQLGVETVEVAEKIVAWQREKSVQVYRAADGSMPAEAVALLTEAEAINLRAGQSVPLKPADSQSPTVTGTLAQLDARTSAVLGQVEALIEFVDPQRRFPVGSFLTATFSNQRSDPVTAIPSAAVVNGVEGAFVYTVNGSHFTRTPVKLGAASDGWVEVVDGLYAGDVVVAKAADKMWMIELCALKGGTPCCPVPKKGRDN